MSTTFEETRAGGEAPPGKPTVRSRSVVERPRRRPNWLVIALSFIILVLLCTNGILGGAYSSLAGAKSDKDLELAQVLAEHEQFVTNVNANLDREEELKKATSAKLVSINQMLSEQEEQDKMLFSLLDELIAKEEEHLAAAQANNAWIAEVKVIVAKYALEIEELKAKNLELWQMQEEKARIMQRMQREINAAWAATNSGLARRGPLMKLLGL